MLSTVTGELLSDLGMSHYLDVLKQDIVAWIETCNSEMKDMLRWQFLDNASKFFRPLTIFACHGAVEVKDIPIEKMRAAMALELFHNVSLIIDDILDRSRFRRGKLTLHCRFGSLPALMASGFITAEGFNMVRKDDFTIARLAELMNRLGVAECVQWRLRRQPLGVEDWRQIASEDTGSMFEVCACLGTRNDRLRKYGGLVGLLYHGCDDVGDVRGSVALGGGGDEDIRDGILTLPAAIAIRDPEVGALFRNPSEESRIFLIKSMEKALPKAEAYLDEIAEEAIHEAEKNAINPEPLITIVKHTRKLSRA